MSLKVQDGQHEYKEYGDFGGSGKKKKYKTLKAKERKIRIEKLGKTLAAGTAATLIFTGSIAMSDSNFADSLSQGLSGTAVSQNNVSPKDIVHTEHAWDDGKVILEATCTEDGLLLLSCTGCDETKEEPIKAKGHKPIPIDESTQATCTKGGHISGTVCEICNETLSEPKETNPLGHDFGKAVTTKNPSCTSKGIATQTCSRCDEKKNTDIPALGHVDSNDDFYCDRCGADLFSMWVSDVSYQPVATDITMQINFSGPLEEPDFAIYPDIDFSFEYEPLGDSGPIRLYIYPDIPEISLDTPAGDQPDKYYSFVVTIYGKGTDGPWNRSKRFGFNFGINEARGLNNIVVR